MTRELQQDLVGALVKMESILEYVRAHGVSNITIDQKPCDLLEFGIEIEQLVEDLQNE